MWLFKATVLVLISSFWLHEWDRLISSRHDSSEFPVQLFLSFGSILGDNFLLFQICLFYRDLGV